MNASKRHPPTAERVLFVANLYKGGSLTLLDEILDQIGSDGRNLVICFRSSALPERLKKARARFICVPYPIPVLNSFYRIVLEQLALPVLGYTSGARTLITFGNFPVGLWFRKQAVFFHNRNYIDASATNGGVSLWIERGLFHMLKRKSKTRFFCQLLEMQRLLTNLGLRASGLRVPGRAWNADSRSIGKERRYRERLLFPAFHYWAKNHRLLLSSVHVLRQFGLRVLLTIPEGSFKSGFGDHLDVFETIGFVDKAEIARLLASECSLVFPSLSESLGYPLIEALSMKCPILAADLPYARAVAGNLAVYFDPHSVISFANALQEYVSRDWSYEGYEQRLSEITCSPAEFMEQLYEEN